ncbi:peptidylprolyl isomerase [Ferruginibacter lapsinanis]|uniref:peptidylprolyl isomerase n=1 Tax=Ferruginibacter lapsinanis TaxID=563172 RepID=UPI001E304FA8|nr:peptidylprolyl isomerase [Ferruginibacter lapsinanis]UEG50865.1 peptidylprolyl isomerase [Ferruginibacter lapsinanis]
MKHIFLFFISHSLFLVSQAQQQKVVADKIIAVVGNKIVLKSEIDNTISDMKRQGVEVPDNAECLTLEQAMGVKALVLQAEKDSIPVSDEEVAADIDNQIRYFINAYGSKEELEKISGKSIYQIKEDFKEGFRDRKLAAAMRNKIVDGIRITPNEVKIYFDKLPKDSLAFYESELEIGQIAVYPKASRDAEEYAVEQLKEFKQQIESGKKDFCRLAALYSEDPGSKDKCGEYEINRSEKQWDPLFMAKAFSLKEGQISAPFKTRFGYHIIQLVSRSGDDAVVRHILKIPQVTAVELKTAVQKLDSVRDKLVTGKIQFGEAVSKYSDDESSKFTGGRKQNAEGSTYLTIDQLDKDMIPAIKNLVPGQYSKPTEFTDERGKKGIRIVYLISKTEPHRENLKDDYGKLAARALEDKKGEALDNWFNKKILGYYIKVDEQYKSCPEISKWVKASAVNVN